MRLHCFFHTCLLAGYLSLACVAEPLKFEGKIVDTLSKVPVYSEASASTKSGPVKLYLSGAGERVKHILFVKVHAYVISSYVASQKKVDPVAPMSAMDDSPVKALHLTFLRDISADRMKSSFKESLEANGVNLKSPEIEKVFAGLNTEVKEKTSLTILGITKAGAHDVLTFSFPERSFSVEGKSLVSDFWKIWFGKPADGGLEDLKTDLISGR